MRTRTFSLPEVIGKLRAQHGASDLLPTTDPFELILWENVAYLASHDRRLEAFMELKTTIGTSPGAIQAATAAALNRITARGILKEEFAAKLRECARIVTDEFADEFTAVVHGSHVAAIRALCRFPGIGEPGAERILLFAGLQPLLAADSNALRVLSRIGLIAEDKSYAKMYAAARAVAVQLPQDVASMQEAHQLLRRHGRLLCKRNAPTCGQCPLSEKCRYASAIKAVTEWPETARGRQTPARKRPSQQ